MGIIQKKAEEQKLKQVQQEEEKPVTNKGLVEKYREQIGGILPLGISKERFCRTMILATTSTPYLMQCTQGSFASAMMISAQLGLEPNTPLGLAYILPYFNNTKKVYEAKFILGYKGLCELAYRSGEITMIQAHEVCENDHFEFEYGLHADLRHIPADENRGEVKKYYAVVTTKNGFSNFVVMSKEQITELAKSESKSYGKGSSPWTKHFDAMALKTVVKRALKYAPLKADLAIQVEQDDSIKQEVKPDMFEVENVLETNEFEYVNTDEDTGEVIEDGKEEKQGE